MAARGELEAIEPSVAAAQERLVSASRSLATCRQIVESDPRSCLLLAWDGVAFPILAAALSLAGYRVTSRQGHHRVAVEASRLLLGEDALLSRVGGLRRSRDRTMYDQDHPDPAEVADFLQDLEHLRTLVAAPSSVPAAHDWRVSTLAPLPKPLRPDPTVYELHAASIRPSLCFSQLGRGIRAVQARKPSADPGRPRHLGRPWRPCQLHQRGHHPEAPCPGRDVRTRCAGIPGNGREVGGRTSRHHRRGRHRRRLPARTDARFITGADLLSDGGVIAALRAGRLQTRLR